MAVPGPRPKRHWQLRETVAFPSSALLPPCEMTEKQSLVHLSSLATSPKLRLSRARRDARSAWRHLALSYRELHTKSRIHSSPSRHLPSFSRIGSWKLTFERSFPKL